jgi:hypothetical protein
MDIYNLNDTVPLSYSRIRNWQKVSGLTVTVAVTNTKTNATLLASRALPETATGSGEYFYSWTHGLVQDTQCTVTYTVNGQNYLEYIFISGSTAGGRAY